jgi:pimeloyl-ACP methyl ester carboxylesterase
MRPDQVARWLIPLLCCALLLQSGCETPIAAEKAPPSVVYRKTHDNPIGQAGLSAKTHSVLHRFDQEKVFEDSPDTTLRLIHQKAVESKERGLLFALAELNYHTGERVRRIVKPWEPRDARDYYLASAVYAWLYLFGDAADPPPGSFDERFRSACDLYNYGLGWALTGRRATNAVAVLVGGLRNLPIGQMELKFSTNDFPYPLSLFDHFIIADQFIVRGLSVRDRQPGLGAPLVGVTEPEKAGRFSRSVPATAFLRLEGGLTNLAQGQIRGTLELHSPFDEADVQVAGASVPLETDTTIGLAYTLNQSFVWELGMAQFFSSEEKIPTGVYLTQPYRPGRVPVVFVHGTFSSPVWWAEMINTLAADPVLRQRCQLWFFIYNSGNPTVYSAKRLRDSLTAKIRELDPNGRDPALQQMVVVGHSQGGLLTKLTATDTDDRLLEAILKTNQLNNLEIPPKQMATLREYTCFDALPFVKRVVFICTPHRGSYLAGNFVRKLARKFVTLPSTVVKGTSELAGLRESLDLPKELKGTPTSLDSMSTNNPALLALADIPVAPGIKANSIIAVQGDGDYRKGKDGLVTYDSAHVGYSESEYIVRSFHSCLSNPGTIEEVRRILREHIAALPPESAEHPNASNKK